MATKAVTPDVTLTDEAAEQLFDRIARKNMNITGEEFLRRWDAGVIQRCRLGLDRRACPRCHGRPSSPTVTD